MANKPYSNNWVVCILGLGYVGMPLALSFSKSLKVIGLDINTEKVKALGRQYSSQTLFFTDDQREINKADFVIICVPTPIDKSNNPDLYYIKSAARITGKNIKMGTTVILESTVYPGVTEDVLKPIVEKESGLVCGKDFFIGYSPERINPGDDEHTVERVIKIVAGMNEEVAETVAELYSKITPKVFKAKNIKTAEAAKLAENIQRDLNIALTNELTVIFNKLGLDSWDVFEAAGTKWNYHRYNPGLVGGLCIPIVPYYLVYRSREIGYEPQVIVAGRKANDAMPGYVAEVTITALKSTGKAVQGARILVMGLTYKGNVSEARESPVKSLIAELKKNGTNVLSYDPLVDEAIIKSEFNVTAVQKLDELKKQKVDAVIITVPHKPFLELGLNVIQEIQTAPPILIDIPGIYKNKEVGKGFIYKTL